MRLHLLEKRSKSGCTTFGSVWNRGEVSGTDTFLLKNKAGEQIPVQSRVTAWWPDGSVKWAAHTADAAQMGDSAELTAAADGPKMAGGINIQVQKGADGWLVDTGRISLKVPFAGVQDAGGRAAGLAQSVCFGETLLVRRIVPVFCLEHRKEETAEGRRIRYTEDVSYEGVPVSAALEEEGPLQCVCAFYAYLLL